MSRDRLIRATLREAARQRDDSWRLECWMHADHAFRCLVCHEQKREEERQAPGSDICVDCMAEAGFPCE